MSMANEHNFPIILAVSGPSGVGKGTCIAALRKMCPAIKLSVSATTRKPRPNEIEGIHYYFISEQQFNDYLKNDEIIEYDTFCGNYYGTPRQAVAKCLEEGKDIALDITVKGSLNVKRFFPNETVTIFIMPPNFNELKQRLIGRGTETFEVVKERLARADRELEQSKEFDYIVVNNEVGQCATELLQIYQAEKAKRLIKFQQEQKKND